MMNTYSDALTTIRGEWVAAATLFLLVALRPLIHHLLDRD